ncbi:kelch repeat-containing protein [Streptomyces sp. M19]
MHEARWYPTLTTLEDGRVLSVSGLDEIGQVVPGKNEIYDPKTRTWSYLPRTRFFPTYPALFLSGRGKVFYTGSNAGYGPDDVGRTPASGTSRATGSTSSPASATPTSWRRRCPCCCPGPGQALHGARRRRGR